MFAPLSKDIVPEAGSRNAGGSFSIWPGLVLPLKKAASISALIACLGCVDGKAALLK